VKVTFFKSSLIKTQVVLKVVFSQKNNNNIFRKNWLKKIHFQTHTKSIQQIKAMWRCSLESVMRWCCWFPRDEEKWGRDERFPLAWPPAEKPVWPFRWSHQNLAMPSKKKQPVPLRRQEILLMAWQETHRAPWRRQEKSRWCLGECQVTPWHISPVRRRPRDAKVTPRWRLGDV